jgi:hypothetical protein
MNKHQYVRQFMTEEEPTLEEKKHVLELIFNRPFEIIEREGTHYIVTDVPGNTKQPNKLGALPQFLLGHFDVLQNLGMLGYSFQDAHKDARYWGVTADELCIDDGVLDSLTSLPILRKWIGLWIKRNHPVRMQYKK